MARFNEILTARYSKFVQKLLSMKGQSAMPQVASELTPALTVFSGAENRFLESWDRFAMNITVAAQGVGNNASARIRNPVGSNVIAVLEAASVWNSTATDAPVIEISRTNIADYAVQAQTNVSMDGRGRPNATCILSAGTRVALQQVLLQKVALVNVTGEFIVTDIQEMTLTPGGTIQISSNNANQGLTVNYMWRERMMEESELK